jgi:hypothetical protein
MSEIFLPLSSTICLTNSSTSRQCWFHFSANYLSFGFGFGIGIGSLFADAEIAEISVSARI